MITDSVRAFGTMAPGQICSTGINGYTFSTMINVPDGHVVNFELDCHDVHDSAWVSYFNETVFAPDLTFREYAVSGGNGNNSLEPGEVVGLIVTLDNDGSAAAESVHATLQCQSNLISILDSTGFYPIIEPGSMATNSADSFVLAADSNAIPGTIMHFTMVVNATFYTDTINFSFAINTGIEETVVDGSIKAEVMDIYPNPCHGTLRIKLNRSALTYDNNTLRIYDANGLMVRAYSLDRNTGIINWPGDDCQGNQLPGGVYFIKFTTQETDRTYKAILIK
jgi:hypothetical protein